MKFSNKEKGIYLVWFSVIFIFYILSGNYGFDSYYIHDFYPFGYGFLYILSDGLWDIAEYDLSEFIIYSIVPILLLYAYKLMTAKKDDVIASLIRKDMYRLAESGKCQWWEDVRDCLLTEDYNPKMIKKVIGSVGVHSELDSICQKYFKKSELN